MIDLMGVNIICIMSAAYYKLCCKDVIIVVVALLNIQYFILSFNLIALRPKIYFKHTYLKHHLTKNFHF